MNINTYNIIDYGLVAHLMISGHVLKRNDEKGFMLVSENDKKFKEDCKEYFTVYKKRLDKIKSLKKQLSKI
jgi:hypothetical protein